jgi:hypothetical protein
VRPLGGGLLDLFGVQIDSVLTTTLPVSVEFDVAIRLVGPPQDFETAHVVDVLLTGPELDVLGELSIPVAPRKPDRTHLPGYELNAHLGARIAFDGYAEGGYDLAFALDGQPEHRHKTTLSVVQKPTSP